MFTMKKYLAEMVGTFVLTFLGCGAAVALGCGADTASVVGTAMAFGLAVVAMAYTIGGISGCHINPAITLGVFLSGRMSAKDCGMYMVFQVIGAILAAAVLAGIVGTASPDAIITTSTGANTCAFGVTNGLIVEIVLTMLFVLVVLGATSVTNGATNNFAGLPSVCRSSSSILWASTSLAPRLTPLVPLDRLSSRVVRRLTSYGCSSLAPL